MANHKSALKRARQSEIRRVRNSGYKSNAKKAVKGYEEFIYGGLSGSTDLGFVSEILAPRKLEVAAFGVIRADNILAHAADEFAYVEDLIDMTKELVYYLGA